MLYKFPTSTNIDPERAQHALVLTQVWFTILLILYVNVECFALQEYLEVGIMLKHGVRSGLVKHALKRRSSRLDKVRIESANCLLLWGRWYNDTRIITVE